MDAMVMSSQHSAIYSVIKERNRVWLRRQNARAVVLFSLAQQPVISMLLGESVKVEESHAQIDIS
jgi:hypothetical protein